MSQIMEPSATNTVNPIVPTNTAASAPIEDSSIRVTVVPPDNLIGVGGVFLTFPYDAPANMHALQWGGESGHIEWTDGPNKVLAKEDYAKQVAPYVTLWQAERDRLEEEAAAAEAARLAQYNSTGARFERLRAERDKRIAATDYLLMTDYPISGEDKAAVQTYRQALRDLPAQEGAPWDGGEGETPWPQVPAVLPA